MEPRTERGTRRHRHAPKVRPQEVRTTLEAVALKEYGCKNRPISSDQQVAGHDVGFRGQEDTAPILGPKLDETVEIAVVGFWPP